MFVQESNAIEGITRPPTAGEIRAHEAFLALDTVKVRTMETFVRDICGAPLRRYAGQNVRVGQHVPPPGGPWIEKHLRDLLHDLPADAHDVHVRYEKLHPFMDGNGRSGRCLWAWMMMRAGRDPFTRPFLHTWYYQTLNAARIATRR